MVRTVFYSVAVLAIFAVGLVRADDAKTKSDKQGTKHVQAVISTIDVPKDMVTVKMMDEDGKEQEKNFQFAKDAKYLDSAGKTAKLDAFHAGDDVCLTEKDDKVTEMRKHAEATITKVDAKAGTITVAMTGKDGKEVEKTFQLMEDAEYLDSTGRIARLEVFQSGDEILFIESDGMIKAVKKADEKEKTPVAKAASVKKSSDK